MNKKKPDAVNHRPEPIYLRELISASGLTHKSVASRLGVSERVIRMYLADPQTKSHRIAPYLFQFGLESLAED